MSHHHQALKSDTPSEKSAGLLSMAEFEALLGKRISTDVPVTNHSENRQDITTWLVLALMAASIGWKIWKDAQPQPKLAYDDAGRLMTQDPVRPAFKLSQGLIKSDDSIDLSGQKLETDNFLMPQKSPVETRPEASEF